jgi:hypothetical protein
MRGQALSGLMVGLKMQAGRQTPRLEIVMAGLVPAMTFCRLSSARH